MSREQAISAAAEYFDSGDFLKDLSRRVAIRTESQLYEERKPDMEAYMAVMSASSSRTPRQRAAPS